MPTVSVDLLGNFENEDQKLEKEKVEEPEVGDGRVDWRREVRMGYGL